MEGQIAAVVARLRQLARVERTGTSVDRWSQAEDLIRRQQVLDQQTDRMWREYENQRNPQFRQDLAKDLRRGPARVGGPPQLSGRVQRQVPTAGHRHQERGLG